MLRFKIIRKIDSLGRIVIPMDIRRAFNINSGDDIEINITGDSILIKKSESKKETKLSIAY